MTSAMPRPRPRPRFFAAAPLASLGASAALVVACSGGGAGSPVALADLASDAAASDSSSPSNGDGGANSSSNGGGAVPPFTRHSPATGCQSGFSACGSVCADEQTDNRHCGGCNHSCFGLVDAGGTPSYTSCVEGTCEAKPVGSCFKLVCNGQCIPFSGIDNCGSCFNQCADNELCVKSQCLGGKGDGASCKTALLAPTDEALEFRYPAGLTDNHVFRCGSGAAVPTRWFRWTASRDQSVGFTVQGAPTTDDYVMELFDAPDCGDMAYVACNDDRRAGAKLARIDVDVKAGTTYIVAIGRVAAPSGVRPAFRVDD